MDAIKRMEGEQTDGCHKNNESDKILRTSQGDH